MSSLSSFNVINTFLFFNLSGTSSKCLNTPFIETIVGLKLSTYILTSLASSFTPATKFPSAKPMITKEPAAYISAPEFTLLYICKSPLRLCFFCPFLTMSKTLIVFKSFFSDFTSSFLGFLSSTEILLLFFSVFNLELGKIGSILSSFNSSFNFCFIFLTPTGLKFSFFKNS